MLTPTYTDATDRKLKVGVSACLLGQEVRFDGAHKRDRDVIASEKWFELVPVCPEVEAGLGIPREPIRMVRGEEGVRVVGTKTGNDVTDVLRKHAEERVRQLASLGLCGFILKKSSPSCGMERVKVYDHNNVPGNTGRGIFAEVLMRVFPLLPVEEEGRLNDPRLREAFFARVFAFARLERLFQDGWSQGDLVAFHSREKILLMANDPNAYRALGRLVAEGHAMERGELQRTYRDGFLLALSKPLKPGRQVNAMQHVTGFFKKELDSDDKAELNEIIAQYAQGTIPLVVPVTLIRSWARRLKVDYLLQQSWLNPHPDELGLRNRV